MFITVGARWSTMPVQHRQYWASCSTVSMLTLTSAKRWQTSRSSPMTLIQPWVTSVRHDSSVLRVAESRSSWIWCHCYINQLWVIACLNSVIAITCLFSIVVTQSKEANISNSVWGHISTIQHTRHVCISVSSRDVGLETWSWSRDRSRPIFWGLGLGLDPAGLGLGLPGLGLGLGLSGLGLGLGGWSWARPEVMCNCNVTCIESRN